MERKDDASLYKNNEISNLILGLGLGLKGEDVTNLRYGKVSRASISMLVHDTCGMWLLLHPGVQVTHHLHAACVVLSSSLLLHLTESSRSAHCE